MTTVSRQIRANLLTQISSTFYFLLTPFATQQKIKRARNATYGFGSDILLNLTVLCLDPRRRASDNSTLVIGGVPSPLDSFEVVESSVLRTNFSAENPAHRQSAKRYK
jgi:hypothetical protein